VSEKTEEELTVWIKEQIDAYDAGTIDPDLAAHLDAEIPGWNDAGARARVTPEPAIEDSEAMAAWIEVNRAAHVAGSLPEGRAAYLDSIAPGWSEPTAADAQPAADEAPAEPTEA
jgi:hypothetical protein